MTWDGEGNIFVAHLTRGTVYVHRPNGEPLTRIISAKGSGTTNIVWGLKDKKALYITESETGTFPNVDWHREGLLDEKYEA